jgi:hypothetical protein
MPQIGTAQWVTIDGTGQTEPPELYAWWQWWVRDAPQNGHVAVRAVPVAANDQIYAQVQAINDATVSMFIINLSSNRAFPFWFNIVQPTQQLNHGPNPLPAHVEGRTAEWIIERPQRLNSNRLYQLANYSVAVFDECNGNSHSHILTDIDLSRSRLIRMTVWDASPGQVPGKVVSIATRNSNNGIEARYIP